MDDRHQLFGGLNAGVVAWSQRVDHVLADVVLDDLGDEAVHRTAAGGGLLQHAGALGLFVDCALEGFELAADAAKAIEELGLLGRDVSHWVPESITEA